VQEIWVVHHIHHNSRLCADLIQPLVLLELTLIATSSPVSLILHSYEIDKRAHGTTNPCMSCHEGGCSDITHPPTTVVHDVLQPHTPDMTCLNKTKCASVEVLYLLVLWMARKGVASRLGRCHQLT
jgi:hypothetical protein